MRLCNGLLVFLLLLLVLFLPLLFFRCRRLWRRTLLTHTPSSSANPATSTNNVLTSSIQLIVLGCANAALPHCVLIP
jgi:hypothetical protein